MADGELNVDSLITRLLEGECRRVGGNAEGWAGSRFSDFERRRGFFFFEARGAKFFLEVGSEAGEPGEGQCGCGMRVSHVHCLRGRGEVAEKMVGWPCSFL